MGWADGENEGDGFWEGVKGAWNSLKEVKQDVMESFPPADPLAEKSSADPGTPTTTEQDAATANAMGGIGQPRTVELAPRGRTTVATPGGPEWSPAKPSSAQATGTIQSTIKGRSDEVTYAKERQAEQALAFQTQQQLVNEAAMLGAKADTATQVADLYEMSSEEATGALQDTKQHMDRIRDNVKVVMNRVMNESIDPNRFFNNRSEASRFSASIAVAAGAANSVFLGQHGKNHALDIINNAIERDVESQQKNLENLQVAGQMGTNLLGQLNTIFNNEMAALEQLKELRLGQAQAQFQKIASQRMAQNKLIDANGVLAGLQLQQAQRQIKRDEEEVTYTLKRNVYGRGSKVLAQAQRETQALQAGLSQQRLQQQRQREMIDQQVQGGIPSEEPSPQDATQQQPPTDTQAQAVGVGGVPAQQATPEQAVTPQPGQPAQAQEQAPTSDAGGAQDLPTASHAGFAAQYQAPGRPDYVNPFRGEPGNEVGKNFGAAPGEMALVGYDEKSGRPRYKTVKGITPSGQEYFETTSGGFYVVQPETWETMKGTKGKTGQFDAVKELQEGDNAVKKTREAADKLVKAGWNFVEGNLNAAQKGALRAVHNLLVSTYFGTLKEQYGLDRLSDKDMELLERAVGLDFVDSKTARALNNSGILAVLQNNLNGVMQAKQQAAVRYGLEYDDPTARRYNQKLMSLGSPNYFEYYNSGGLSKDAPRYGGDVAAEKKAAQVKKDKAETQEAIKQTGFDVTQQGLGLSQELPPGQGVLAPETLPPGTGPLRQDEE